MLYHARIHGGVMTKGRWLLLAAFTALIAAFFGLHLNRYLSLETLKAQRDALVLLRDAHPLAASLAYLLAYIGMATLSLPGGGILTLTAGAVFGLLWGVWLVLVAAGIGATTAMLAARFVLHDAIQARYGARLQAVHAGFARDGAFYLFTARLAGLPFFIINALMGLVPIRVWTYYWVSVVGMIPGTVVLVNAGRQLAQVESMGDVLSPQLIGSFLLLGVFPLLTRALAQQFRKSRSTPRD